MFVTKIGYTQPQNIVFILSDDHRYDYMGFHPDSPDFLETPWMDRMAAEGAHMANAFVTTSLCSPSRVSILTGQYPFRHGAVDNGNPMYEGTLMYPAQLQEAGLIKVWSRKEKSWAEKLLQVQSRVIRPPRVCGTISVSKLSISL